MRVFVKAKMCTETANAAAKNGTMGSTIQSILDDQKPEVVYFAAEAGVRTAYFVVNLDDASQIPAVAEPWFLAFNAEISFHPVMTPEDLAKATPAIEQSVKKYG